MPEIKTSGTYGVANNYGTGSSPVYASVKVRMFWIILIKGVLGVWAQGAGRHWALYLNLPKKMYSVHFRLPKLGL